MTQSPEENPDPLAKGSAPQPQQPPYGVAPGSSPYVQPPTGSAPGPGWTPYAPGGPGMPAFPFAQAHSGANIAMGLGIASVVCAVLTPFVCITMPGVLTGPFAVVLAVRARKEMALAPGAYNNPGAATAGLVTGIIGTVLGVVMIALVVLVLGVFVGFGS